MRIQINPFPAVYFSAICEKHETRVELAVFDDQRPSPSSGRIVMIRCFEGGEAKHVDGCQDSWRMTISPPSDVTITH